MVEKYKPLKSDLSTPGGKIDHANNAPVRAAHALEHIAHQTDAIVELLERLVSQREAG